MVLLLRPRCIICVTKNLVNLKHLARRAVRLLVSFYSFAGTCMFLYFAFSFLIFFVIRTITYYTRSLIPLVVLSNILLFSSIIILSAALQDLFNDSGCIIMLQCLTVFFMSALLYWYPVRKYTNNVFHITKSLFTNDAIKKR